VLQEEKLNTVGSRDASTDRDVGNCEVSNRGETSKSRDVSNARTQATAVSHKNNNSRFNRNRDHKGNGNITDIRAEVTVTAGMQGTVPAMAPSNISAACSQCFESGSTLIRLFWIQVCSGNGDPDPDPRELKLWQKFINTVNLIP
jgi:hypothetical protein